MIKQVQINYHSNHPNKILIKHILNTLKHPKYKNKQPQLNNEKD